MKQAIKKLEKDSLETCAKLIVKYQKFRTDKVYKKFLEQDSIMPSKSTAINYINYGISYIKYGKKVYSIRKEFYDCIDKCIAEHIQPLTPSPMDARRELVRKYEKKETVLPVQKTVQKIIQKEEITSKFDYGIKIDNRIILFKSEDEMEQFIKNLRFINPETELKAVTVSYDKLW